MRRLVREVRSRAPVHFAVIAIIVQFAAAIALSSCQQLFTTSLAKPLARKNLTLPANLTSSQASELAAEAKANNDTQLASALVTNLVDQIDTTTDPVLKQELQISAANSAIVASGVGSSITDLAGTLSSGQTPDAATITNLLAEIKTGATSDVVTALSYLDPSTPSGAGIAATADSGLGATDYAIAAAVVAASVLPADPTTMTDAEIATFKASPEGQLAIRLADQAQALSKDDPSSADLLSGFFDNFQLTTTTTP